MRHVALPLALPRPVVVAAKFGNTVRVLRCAGVDGGGFRCVPGFSRRLRDEPTFAKTVAAWRHANGDNAPSGCKDLPEMTGMPCRTIAASKGDLVIWDSFLPHGNDSNRGNRPRLACFVSMAPCPRPSLPGSEWEARRRRRIVAWQEQLAGEEGEPGDRAENLAASPENRGPAQLSALGEKLLGVQSWWDE